MSLKEIKDCHGKPLLEIKLDSYTKDERLVYDIPIAVAVFARPRVPSGIIVYGKIPRGEWVPNHGHRQLIRHLMKLNKII